MHYLMTPAPHSVYLEMPTVGMNIIPFHSKHAIFILHVQKNIKKNFLLLS